MARALAVLALPVVARPVRGLPVAAVVSVNVFDPLDEGRTRGQHP